MPLTQTKNRIQLIIIAANPVFLPQSRAHRPDVVHPQVFSGCSNIEIKNIRVPGGNENRNLVHFDETRESRQIAIFDPAILSFSCSTEAEDDDSVPEFCHLFRHIRSGSL